VTVAQRWLSETDLHRSWMAILGTVVVAAGGTMIGLRAPPARE
jgi:hypothetical protein